MKKVKVIKEKFNSLTVGNEYEVLSENDKFIVVISDKGIRTKFTADVFEEVKPKKGRKKKEEAIVEEVVEVEQKEEWQGGYDENYNAEEV